MFDNEENYFEQSTSEKINKSVAEIFKGLNPEQKKAVETLEDPLLIMAGAGSGKTKVLTCRMANLLAHGVPAWNILAITFTNKAADEMKERAEKMIGEVAQSVWIGTFHSLCAKLLRREIEVTKKYKRNYVIYDTSDTQVLIRECIKELNLNDAKFVSGAISRISSAKNDFMDAKEYRESLLTKKGVSDYDKHCASIYELYEKKLIENNALDFDDLILVMVKILQNYPEIREKYQEKFKYILIDEYQDTNTAQYLLTKYLAEKYKNICVVGDADQSIYGWRGADMHNILNFEKDYPNAKVIKLEQNYRSTKRIVAAANSVIRCNVVRKEKNLWTKNLVGEKIRFRVCKNDILEAAFIAREINRLVKSENVRYNEIAILYRTNSQTRILEDRLMNSQIPYTIIGGLRFYERKEIKDILAYLRIIYNPLDSVSLQRIINVPRRGIGNTSFSRLAEYAEQNHLSILEVIANHLDKFEKFSLKLKEALRDFVSMIFSFHELQKNLLPVDLIKTVLDKSGYLQALKSDEGNRVENLSRIENLGQFINSAVEFQEKNETPTLEEFLNHVSLITDLDALNEKNNDKTATVSMMTIHSAKGLEFPIVFIAGMEEGLLPHSNSMLDSEKLEEERRACYVAMTRAEKILYITSAAKRSLFGKIYDTKPSRFIKEIEPECMEKIVEHKNDFQIKTAPAVANFPKKIYSAPTAHSAPKIKILSNKPKEKIDWNVGDQARHKKWGLGTVMSVDGDSLKIVFANPEIGEKTLRSSIAPVEKA